MKLKKGRKKGDREKKGEALQNWETPGQIGRVVMYDLSSSNRINKNNTDVVDCGGNTQKCRSGTKIAIRGR